MPACPAHEPAPGRRGREVPPARIRIAHRGDTHPGDGGGTARLRRARRDGRLRVDGGSRRTGVHPHVHSHGDDREQSSHGLFGAVIVEPAGSRWIDPRTGADIETGWDAMISGPGRADFREFALFYHEIGDENYQVLDRDGEFVPARRPVHELVPARRARAQLPERAVLQPAGAPAAAHGQTVDESLAYSSYSFGDPATPIAAQLPRRPREAAGRARRLGGLPRAPRARRLDPLAHGSRDSERRVRRAARQDTRRSFRA